MTESKRTTLPEEFIKKLDEIAKSYGFETSVKNEEKKEEESSEEEKENKKKGSYIEDYIFSNYKIRDLESHFSEITEIKDYDVVTIVITNSHDKQIAFRIYMSPISSRNIVPPFASSKRPARSFMALVNAPFSWPKSSLSRSSSGIAPQLIGTKGRFLRALLKWIAFAISSFPVPLSPRISTVLSVSATFSTIL